MSVPKRAPIRAELASVAAPPPDACCACGHSLTLTQLATWDALAAAKKLLQDPDPQVRLRACQLLLDQAMAAFDRDVLLTRVRALEEKFLRRLEALEATGSVSPAEGLKRTG